ncbi:hypothetical protein CYMTET_55266 [Cymbomonas tetramitiformis]|uniref:Protein kinase domain-containing protein n=1 Tax=Cymbomonas tetramitiformis TaxID=36881 RepID=A0AAE0BDN5_9CHLO|nr:hypothetical protein CYMTET_55266 [Cymbomonas tetramitiformis]
MQSEAARRDAARPQVTAVIFSSCMPTVQHELRRLEMAKTLLEHSGYEVVSGCIHLYQDRRDTDAGLHTFSLEHRAAICNATCQGSDWISACAAPCQAGREADATKALGQTLQQAFQRTVSVAVVSHRNEVHLFAQHLQSGRPVVVLDSAPGEEDAWICSLTPAQLSRFKHLLIIGEDAEASVTKLVESARRMLGSAEAVPEGLLVPGVAAYLHEKRISFAVCQDAGGGLREVDAARLAAEDARLQAVLRGDPSECGLPGMHHTQAGWLQREELAFCDATPVLGCRTNAARQMGVLRGSERVEIKVVSLGQHREAAFAELICEVAVLARMPVHQHLARLRGAGRWDPSAYFVVMELGQSNLRAECDALLRPQLSVPRSRDGLARRGPATATNRFPALDVLQLILGAARGLDAMHRSGLLHRALHCTNVHTVKSYNPNTPGAIVAKLCDFGLVAVADPGRLPGAVRNILGSRSSEVLLPGSAKCYPPDARYTYATDVYMFGACILWELPHQAEWFGNLSEAEARHAALQGKRSLITVPLDPIYESLLLACVEADPEKRPTSAQVVTSLEELQAVLVIDHHEMSEVVQGYQDLSKLETDQVGEYGSLHRK